MGNSMDVLITSARPPVNCLLISVTVSHCDTGGGRRLVGEMENLKLDVDAPRQQQQDEAMRGRWRSVQSDASAATDAPPKSRHATDEAPLLRGGGPWRELF